MGEGWRRRHVGGREEAAPELDGEGGVKVGREVECVVVHHHAIGRSGGLRVPCDFLGQREEVVHLDAH